MDLKVLDIFAGAGGFSLGFRENVVVAIENHPHIVKSYRANFPNVTLFAEDVKRVCGRDIVSCVGKIDIVIGGPPCEPFTSMNTRRMKDPYDRLFTDSQGRLILEFIRLVDELRPKLYILENVPELITEPLGMMLKKLFNRIGYEAYFNIIDAEKYGVPSRRRRVFISNIEIDLSGMEEEPEKTGKILGDMPPIGSLPNHKLVSVGKVRLQKIKKLRWGEALFKFRDSEGHVRFNWLRLHPEKIAPTIYGKARFIHPYEDRLLTVREQARLMTFPDSHVFYGGVDRQFDQVGEAVPPKLSSKIAKITYRKISEL
ncbi:MAG: DNA cytosine methyltransferase [Nitrososphaerota archaeon]